MSDIFFKHSKMNNEISITRAIKRYTLLRKVKND